MVCIEKFEGTKCVMRSHESKDKQCNGQQKKDKEHIAILFVVVVTGLNWSILRLYDQESNIIIVAPANILIIILSNNPTIYPI